MKNIVKLSFGLLLCGATFTACRSRSTATDPNAPPPASPSAPDTAIATNSTTALQISSVKALQSSLDSLMKKYPEIHASNNDGVVTLSGSMREDQLPPLLTAVESLHPKKVNNNIRVK